MDESEFGVVGEGMPHASPRRREPSDAFGAVERVVADQMSSLATTEFDDELDVMDAEVEVASGRLTLVERLNDAQAVRFTLGAGAVGSSEVEIFGDVIDISPELIWVRTSTGDFLISMSTIVRAAPVPVTGSGTLPGTTTSILRRFANETDMPTTFELLAGRSVVGRIVRVGADHADVMVAADAAEVWSVPLQGVRYLRSTNRSS